jgi:hypothetical protein
MKLEDALDYFGNQFQSFRFMDILHLIVIGCYVYGALIVHYDDPSYLGIGPW